MVVCELFEGGSLPLTVVSSFIWSSGTRISRRLLQYISAHHATISADDARHFVIYFGPAERRIVALLSQNVADSGSDGF